MTRRSRSTAAASCRPRPSPRASTQPAPRPGAASCRPELNRSGASSETGDERVYEGYYRLSGEGWSDAVLGVFLPDLEHGVRVRLWNRIGVVLCLLAAPVLLLLFSEAIAVLSNLRVRLMAVMTFATLVPLAILSVVLVQVLESGHESGLQGGMQQAIKAATQRLEEQQQDLLDSARTWLDPLVTEIVDGGPEGASETHRAALQESLEATMESQKPPDWDGGFMRLEFSEQESGTGVTAFVGDDALRTAETPLRKTPGIYCRGAFRSWASVGSRRFPGAASARSRWRAPSIAACWVGCRRGGASCCVTRRATRSARSAGPRSTSSSWCAVPSAPG